MLKFSHLVVATALMVPFAMQAPAQDRAPHDQHAGEHAAAREGQSHGVGVVRSVDAKAGTITIAHEPIPALNWPAMTMSFKVTQPEMLEHVAAGNKVEFTLQGRDMSAVITSIKTAE
jgi:Cu(I)/Ag(I) efflux system protein CusF